MIKGWSKAMLRIRELTKKNHVSQQQLASYLGVTQAALSGWENEKYSLDSKSLCKIADYFHCSTDYLLCRTDHPDAVMRQAPEGSGVDYYTQKENVPPLTAEEIIELRSFLENLKN